MDGFQHWVPCTWHLPCRNPLVGTGWAISLIFITNGHRKGSSAFVGALFFGTADSFQLREAVTNWRALTIVNPLMSGWGRGHEILRDLMEEHLAKVSGTSSWQK